MGAGKGREAADTAASLFPPREKPVRELAPAALPPAPAPGIVIEPPRADPPPVPLPPDVPPPAPPTLTAPPPRHAGPAPGAMSPQPPATLAPATPLLAAPMPAPVTAPVAVPEAAVPMLAAPSTDALVTLPAALASALPDLPPPLPLPQPQPAQTSASPAPDGPQEVVELADLRDSAVTVGQPGFWGGQLTRLVVGPTAPLPAPTPLLEGTERFTNEFAVTWHREPRATPAADVACYFANDAIVTGPGYIWLDGKLVTSTEVMPPYVYTFHGIATERGRLLRAHDLPLREIAAPCVVLLGHGVQVYGHFLIELLFRALLVQRAVRDTGFAVRWLLDAEAPAWLLRILHDDLGIAPDAVELFRPATERVRLRQAILPGLVHGNAGFHPLAGDLVEELLANLAPLPEAPPAPRLFVARRGFRNPHPSHSMHRECRNEAALVTLAAARGFVAIAPEELSWRQQLALFHNAALVVGPFGSALHTALAAPAGTRIGVLGMLNTTQSEIASLRGHRIGYLTEGFEPRDQFSVPEDAFAAFLDALGAPEQTRRPTQLAAQRPGQSPSVVVMSSDAALPGTVAIERPEFGKAKIGRYVVAPAASPRGMKPLLGGTEGFASPAQRALHREPRQPPPREAACYFVEDAVVGGGGSVWVDGVPVTAPELLARPPAPSPETDAPAAPLPLRTVEGDCVVIPGPFGDGYAGFVTETLPRILLARRAVYYTGERIRLLLDAAAPNWLVRLLRADLGFEDEELERFTPETERVLLRRALLPALLYGEGGYHPLVNELVQTLVNRLELPEVPHAARLFVQRPVPQGPRPDGQRADCRNLAALAALAEAQGFEPVTLDTLPWRERVARLAIAQVVVAAPGFAAHSLLFAGEGTRVGAIGARGTLVAELAALRGHRVAYLSEGIPAKGPYELSEDRLAAFLAALCDPKAEAARAA